MVESPYFRFICALKSPETKRQYPKRLEVFLDYLKLQGSTIEDKANVFYGFIRLDSKTFQNALLNYFIFQNERARKGETCHIFRSINNYLIDYRSYLVMTLVSPRENTVESLISIK